MNAVNPVIRGFSIGGITTPLMTITPTAMSVGSVNMTRVPFQDSLLGYGYK